MSTIGVGQGKKTLHGYLGVEGGLSYSYELTFTDSGGVLSGYSYTYLEPGKDVKAAISGVLDYENKTLSFQETEIVYNRGFNPGTTICLIRASLTWVQNDQGEGLRGDILSKDAGQVYCGRGTLVFTQSAEIQRLFQVRQPDDPAREKTPVPAESVSVVYVYDTVRAIEAPKPVSKQEDDDRLESGDERHYVWETSTLKISILDDGRIDGDRVSLFWNGKVVLDNFQLLATRKQISLDLLPLGENILRIRADNEGNEPPNTARVILHDGIKTHKLTLHNRKGKEVILYFLRKD